MRRLIVAFALSGLLVVGACSGGEQPITGLHGVGYVDERPTDVSSYIRGFSIRGIDFYGGSQQTHQGVWFDWYADIAAVPAAAFGIAFDPFGQLYPWAVGPVPDTILAANPALYGTASWGGALMGVGVNDIIVGGFADMAVDLNTMTGSLDFRHMEYWTRIDQVLPGTGIRWSDGDLNYRIAVTGNYFTDTGGDGGVVEGGFFGDRHDAMGGWLKRTDLIATFGGER